MSLELAFSLRVLIESYVMRVDLWVVLRVCLSGEIRKEMV